jgi:hypothetical protein
MNRDDDGTIAPQLDAYSEHQLIRALGAISMAANYLMGWQRREVEVATHHLLRALCAEGEQLWISK